MSQIKMSSIIYSLTIINLIIQIKNKIIIKENKSSINITTKLLLELGNYSYGIYFIHCFWILIITKIFKYYIININFIIYSFLELILVVLLSYISIRVVKKIMKNEIAEKVFGF
jgi:peptidoglycan/LPS O-acetylase OafA/YrhL